MLRNIKYKQKNQAKHTRHIKTVSNCGLLSVAGRLVRLVKFRASQNFSNKINWTPFLLMSALDNYPSCPEDGGEPALQCVVEWLPLHASHRTTLDELPAGRGTRTLQRGLCYTGKQPINLPSSILCMWSAAKY